MQSWEQNIFLYKNDTGQFFLRVEVQLTEDTLVQTGLEERQNTIEKYNYHAMEKYGEHEMYTQRCAESK